jgi:hypothetical protein
MASPKRGPNDPLEPAPRSLKVVTPGQPIARDLRTILEHDYPEQRWLVPGLLAYECNLMAAAPKTGKSTLALMFALYIIRMTAQEAGCAMPPTVLYISPDDTDEGGLKERANRLCDGFVPDWGRIEFWFDGVEHIGDGLEEQINDYLDAHPACVYVVVDALFSVLPEDDSGKITVSEHKAMRSLCKLQERRGVALTILHHDNKNSPQPGDRSAKISGSRGLTAGVHSYTILTRPDDSPVVEYFRQPRKGHPVQTAFRLDELSIDWEPNLEDLFTLFDTAEAEQAEREAFRAEREAEAIRKKPRTPGPMERKILDVLEHSAERLAPKQIAEIAELRRVTVRWHLSRMLARKQVSWEPGGVYGFGPQTPQTPQTPGDNPARNNAPVGGVGAVGDVLPPGHAWARECMGTCLRRVKPASGETCTRCGLVCWERDDVSGAPLYICRHCHPRVTHQGEEGTSDETQEQDEQQGSTHSDE